MALTFSADLLTDLTDDSGSTETFTRGSAGTYVNSSSNVASATTNTARFDYVGGTNTGVLIEESRENLVIQSGFDAGWGTQNCTLDLDTATSPLNTTTAARINVDTSAGTYHGIFDSLTHSAGSNHAISIFNKDDGAGFGSIAFGNVGTDHTAIVCNLTTGAITDTDVGSGTGTIDTSGFETLGSSWFRPWMVGSHSGTGTDYCLPYTSDVAVPSGWTGGRPDWTPTAGEDTLIWGAQIELGDFPTSIIETDGSTVTRSADFLSYNDDTVISDSAGTIYLEFTPEFNSTASISGVLVNIADQLIGPLYIVDDTTPKVRIGDGTNTSTYDPTFVRGQTYRIGARWSSALDEIQVYVDGTGSTAAAYDDTFTRTAGTLYVGSSASANHCCGAIKNIRIYDTDVGGTQLDTWTTSGWTALGGGIPILGYHHYRHNTG